MRPHVRSRIGPQSDALAGSQSGCGYRLETGVARSDPVPSAPQSVEGRKIRSILPDSCGFAQHSRASFTGMSFDELIDGFADQFALPPASTAGDSGKLASLPTG